MIDLNVTEPKKIKFGVSVSGVQTRDLRGTLRLMIEGIEYGFPATIVDDKLIVEIPALEGVKPSISDGEKLNGQLEVIAGDTFLVPWTDNFRIHRPVKVEARISEVEEIKEKKKPSAKVKLEDEIPLLKEDKIKKRPAKQKPKSKFARSLGE